MQTLTLEGEPQGALVRPDDANGWGVLVVSGSSGRVEIARAELFAAAAAAGACRRRRSPDRR